MKQFKTYLDEISLKEEVTKIRPKTIFKFIEETSKGPVNMNFYIPSSEIGSLTTLECSILISLIKIFNPKSIFEFGTFLGYSTSLLLKNSDESCKVFSIDLGNDINASNIDYSKILSNDEVNDAYLKIIQSKLGPTYIQQEMAAGNDRLKLLYGNSMEIDTKSLQLYKNMNFVFIDGGHDFETIKSDTNKAYEMIDSGIIIWHDYSSKIHTDVTEFLNIHCKNRRIFHVENTMLAFEII